MLQSLKSTSRPTIKSTKKKRILAVMTHHCALKIRKKYYFEDSITKETLAVFEGMDLQINEFSKFVEGAKDNFKLISKNPAIIVSGVVTDKVFDVFFGSMSGDTDELREQSVAAFEKKLLELNLGTEFFYHENLAS